MIGILKVVGRGYSSIIIRLEKNNRSYLIQFPEVWIQLKPDVSLEKWAMPEKEVHKLSINKRPEFSHPMEIDYNCKVDRQLIQR